MKSYTTLFVTCMCCVMLAVCLDTAPVVTDNRGPTLESLATDVALAHYESFEALAGTLKAQAATFCEAPTSDGLQAVKDAWWAARTPWKRAEVVQFGPVVEFPSRFGPKIDRWPVDPDEVEALIASDTGLTQADFDLMGVLTRGLPVIEYLLWNDADNALTALTDNPRRCEYLVGLAADAETNAGRLISEWKQDWIPQLTDPKNTPGSVYPSTKDVLDEWVNRMIFTVENMRKRKIGKPMGDDSQGTPLLSSLESRASARSLMDSRDVLDGVYDVWTGDVNADNPGVIDLVQFPTLIESIETLFADAKSRLAAIPEPLERAILEQPELVAAAQESLKALQVVFQTDLANTIGVTLMFNDADGD